MARFMDVHNGFARPCPPGHMSSPVCWLSFPRIIDVPFEICVATLESWQRTGQGGELHIGQACCAGRSSTIATAVPAGSRLAWPGGRCGRRFA